MDDDGSSSPDLPEGLIEAILSKSDVKSVIRSQSVSKSIASIISDPRFPRIHRLRRSQLPENQNKSLIWAKPKTKPDYRFYLIKFEAGKFTTESVFPYQSRVIPLCSCDGLVLLDADVDKHPHLLWNPSIRKTTTIRGGAAHPHPEMYDFYYDSVTDDYKIVFVFEDRYAVYSCKDMIWSETRDLPCDLSIIDRGDAVDGCFYGLCGVDKNEIMCFDAREGTAERLRQPEGVKGLIEVTVKAISGRLCLYGLSSDGQRMQMWVMEKSGRSFDCSWRKVVAMEKAESNNLCLFWPLFLSNEDEVVITRKVWEEEGVKHFIYNPHQKGLREIELDWIRAYSFPYSENLYMPCSNSNVQVEM